VQLSNSNSSNNKQRLSSSNSNSKAAVNPGNQVLDQAFLLQEVLCRHLDSMRLVAHRVLRLAHLSFPRDRSHQFLLLPFRTVVLELAVRCQAPQRRHLAAPCSRDSPNKGFLRVLRLAARSSSHGRPVLLVLYRVCLVDHSNPVLQEQALRPLSLPDCRIFALPLRLELAR
jgi:hypothetical protein